jgi:hypothetical protein
MANGIGYGIGGVLEAWAQYGVFAYVLPFLMIFAIVYGILSKTKILGDNKGVQATIALTVGLLALQFDYVSNFFATIFPYTGIGLAILLVALILMGLITGENVSWAKYIWLGIGGIIFLIIVMASVDQLTWFGGGFGGVDWPAIIAAFIVLAVLAFIIWGGKKATSSGPSG